MKAICAKNDRQNKYFAWAAADLPNRKPVDTGTAEILEEFESIFRDTVPTLDPNEIAKACLISSRIRLRRPYELAPIVRNRPIVRKPGPGLVFSAENLVQG